MMLAPGPAYNHWVEDVRVRTTGLLTSAVLLALLLAFSVSGCDPAERSTAGNGQTTVPDTDTAAADDAVPEYTWDGPVPDSATIAYVGNFRGFLKPCGCAVQQSGGLLRLGEVMAELDRRYIEGIVPEIDEDTAPKPEDIDPALQAMGLPGEVSVDYASWPEHTAPHPVWLIECGNFASPTTHYPAERTKTHLSALEHLKPLGFIAAVIGSTELQLDRQDAEAAFADAPVRLTSCNLTCDLDGVEVLPWVEITPGWYLVGVTAWSGGEVPEDAWWELSDPVESARRTIAELPEDAAVLLVAQHQPGEVVRELATLPITAMIGHGSQNDPQWTADLARSFPPPPGKGIRLKLIDLARDGTGTPWDVPLDEAWGDDAVILGLIEAEKDRIKEMLLATLGDRNLEGWRDVDWGTSDKYLPDRQGTLEAWAAAERSIYVGPRECDKCHPDCYNVWKDTVHSHALLSLVDKDEHQTLDCLQCHVAGLLEPSGYDPFQARDEVSAVTCEACHGPGSRHVAFATLGGENYVFDETEVIKGDLDNCVDCHDSYNSPDFDRRKYWEEIVHEDTWQRLQH